MRRISTLSLGVLVAAAVLVAAIAWAGSPNQGSMAKPSPEQVAAMKDAMMKCAVCKNLAAHLDAIGPISMNVVKLDNGCAETCAVAPAGLAEYRKAMLEVHQAGAACMNMTDEQAKSQLCEFCQGIRSSLQAGALMSNGETKNGTIMVLASKDPAVQGQLAALGEKCAMMSGQQQASR